MEHRRPDQPRMPIAEDVDDVLQLLSEAVDDARASLEFTLTTAPDLLEPEVAELAAAVAIDARDQHGTEQ